MVIVLKTGTPETGNHEYTKKDACCTDIFNTFKSLYKMLKLAYTQMNILPNIYNFLVKGPLKAWDGRI